MTEKKNTLPGSRKVTTQSLLRMKGRGERITALTAYDYLMGELLDQAGIDVILVGDSAAMTIQGRHTTVSVTLEQMIYHAEVVAHGVERALVVADLPFMSYQVNPDEGLRNAGRMIKEAHVEAVKLEGGEKIAPTIRRIVDAGIPVMGHLGLTPQSIHKFGTYQVRATSKGEADEIRRDVVALQEAGAFAVVMEMVPADLAGQITRKLTIPTVGIGAGNETDAQVLVWQDMAGLTHGKTAKFVKRFADVGSELRSAAEQYADEVRRGAFPAPEHSY